MTGFSIKSDVEARNERQVLPTDQLPEGATCPSARAQLRLTPSRRGKPPIHWADMESDQRKEHLDSVGLPSFRANQISRQYFGNYQNLIEKMTDIPSSARSQLQELLPELITQAAEQRADKGLTIKHLWRLFDGLEVESVLMRYPKWVTLCVSSQVGCGMGCPFCATGQLGLSRNLSAAEILEQVRMAAYLCANGEIVGGPTRLSNIVFMGMGEPLANYKTLVKVLHSIINPVPKGFGISARRVTVSTVGLVPGIKRLAGEGLPVTLAVSLHAPDDELRDQLIPMNSRYKVKELLDEAYNYYKVTGRRVSIEYALIKDMNDHPWRAQLLADEIKSRAKGWAHVNPIPLNPTPGSIWTASEPKRVKQFLQILADNGITATLRDTRGSDIDGACGQLAAKMKKQGVNR